jgi:hypothetical protein
MSIGFGGSMPARPLPSGLPDPEPAYQTANRSALPRSSVPGKGDLQRTAGQVIVPV